MQAENGVPADRLRTQWPKSSASNLAGSCVQTAAPADGTVAVRNSRHPAGPALIYIREQRSRYFWPGPRKANSTTSV
jgi:uncharacterized protein DUF397